MESIQIIFHTIRHNVCNSPQLICIKLSFSCLSMYIFIKKAYFTWSDNEVVKPSNFDNACYAFGIWNIIGNVASIYYNLIFCVILAYSIQKTLKGFLFNRFRYHLISLLLTGGIILVLILTERLGRGLNGVCGFRVASK